MKQALEMALEALLKTQNEGFNLPGSAIREAITAIKEALAQQEQDNAYIYASNLAKTIWQKHYIKESPKFALLDTTEGVLTQIDNMTCGLVREKPAQPEQEPVAYLSNKRQRINIEIKPQTFVEIPTVTDWEMPLYMKPPQRTWVGLTDEEMEEIRKQAVDLFVQEVKTTGKGRNEPIKFGRLVEAKLKDKNERFSP